MPNDGSATRKKVGWRIRTATVGVLALIAVPLGSDAAELWRWPDAAVVSCEAAGPDRVMDVYMAPDRTSVGRHVLRRCRPGSTAIPDLIVTTQLRFTKRAAVVAALDVTVDHVVLEWHRNGHLSRAVAYARGNGACGSLVSGECRFELAAAADGTDWSFRRTDQRGEHVETLRAEARHNGMWDPDVLGASRLADSYSGTVWTMHADPVGVGDDLEGRPVRRHHLKAVPQGAPLLASRYERVLWIAADGEVLRGCDFHREFGMENVTEFVRADLGIAPGHDCTRRFP